MSLQLVKRLKVAHDLIDKSYKMTIIKIRNVISG